MISLNSTQRDAVSDTVTDSAIHVRGIEKAYGGLQVLRGVDFDVTPGSIFALLGSNGAGKTTLVRILSTLLRADTGEAIAQGTTSRQTRRACARRSASPISSRRSTKC